MKKGKTSKLELFQDAKCYYGSVDATELKSIYLVLQTWVKPTQEKDNWDRVVGTISRNIKHKVLCFSKQKIFARCHRKYFFAAVLKSNLDTF